MAYIREFMDINFIVINFSITNDHSHLQDRKYKNELLITITNLSAPKYIIMSKVAHVKQAPYRIPYSPEQCEVTNVGLLCKVTNVSNDHEF